MTVNVFTGKDIKEDNLPISPDDVEFVTLGQYQLLQNNLIWLVKELQNIEIVYGYAWRENFGADNYADPGIIFLQRIIDEMSKNATKALESFKNSKE